MLGRIGYLDVPKQGCGDSASRPDTGGDAQLRREELPSRE
jgi:hypothetical protein